MPKDKRKRKTFAAKADKYDLYQQSVQEPECEVEFFDKAFEEQFGRTALLLREDFCGTAAVCCEWVKSQKDRRAIGVDLDPEPIDWCRNHTFSKLKSEQQDRITFILDDVRKQLDEKAEIISAQNFSFFLFTTRDELRGYFESARDNLADEGLLVLDMMGGSEVFLDDHSDVTEKDDFTYEWEQATFDPITHHCKFHIHFKFPDGSKLKKAFTYEWRLWTLPEVCELLREAGYSEVHVYWEGVDDDGEGDGVFTRATCGTADPAWVAYVIAVNAG